MKFTKFFLLFVFLTFWKFNISAQEQRLNFSQARSTDLYGDVLYDWHEEQNTVVLFPSGNNEVIWWIKSNGDTISFYNPKKTTGYDADGYFYEEYEATYWNYEFDEEDVVYIRRFTEDGLLLISFWDGKEGFFP